MLSAGMVRSLLRVVVSVFDFFREFGRESEGVLQKKSVKRARSVTSSRLKSSFP